MTELDIVTQALRKSRLGYPLTPEEQVVVEQQRQFDSGPVAKALGRFGSRFADAYASGEAPSLTWFRESGAPRQATGAPSASLPGAGYPHIDGRDARLREGDYPDSNRTLTAFPQPTPEDRVLQLTALGLGGGASASYRGGPGMAKVAPAKQHDVARFLKELEGLPPANQLAALEALQAANPAVTSANMDKTGVERSGFARMLANMAADNSGRFLGNAGKSYLDASEKKSKELLAEQMATRLDALNSGEKRIATGEHDRADTEKRLLTLVKGYSDLNKDELAGFTARSNDAYHRAAAGIQSATLAQQSAARGAAVKQKEAMLELALNAAEGGGATLIPGRKGFRPATQKDILAASMALLGKEAKQGGEDDLKASDLKTLGDSVYATDLQAALGYIPDARTIKGFAEGKLRLAIDPLTKKQTLVAP